MKQITIFVLFAAIVASCSNGEALMPEPSADMTTAANSSQFHVTLSEALEAGNEMFKELYGSDTRSITRNVSTVEMLDSKCQTRVDEIDGFYVVNYTEGGFAILSADRRREPVYAISDKGSLNLSDTTLNSGLSWYINDAIPYMDVTLLYPSLPLDSIPLYPAVPPTYMEIKPKLSGFLTQFHQGYPYNKYCLTGCLAGCAPIAVGTICAYYEWPLSYGGYNFNWAEMKEDASHDSWARLFWVTGLPENLNTDYDPEKGSGTKKDRFVKAFKNLGYRNPLHVTFTPANVWSELWNDQLVFVDGLRLVESVPEKKYSGHTWIIDGAYRKIYDYSNLEHSPIIGETIIRKYYFNCLWGWGGISNGYYYYDECLGGTPDRYTGIEIPAPVYDTELEIIHGFEKNI